MIVAGLVGYERRLALSKDKTNCKWRPLHEGARFNATGRRNKKLLAKNNWYKRKARDVIITSPKKRQRSGVDPEVGKEGGPQDVGTEEGQNAAAALEDARRHQDGEHDKRQCSQNQITPIITQSATIQAAVARYVQVPIQINMC